MVAKEIRFKITEELFFNNGKAMLNALPDIRKNLIDALSMKESVHVAIRKEKGKDPYKGINATSLNVALRRCLEKHGFNKETHVENGVLFHKSKEGFDFSSYDEKYNISRLYNYYLGTVGVLNGDEKILKLHKKLGQSKREWQGKIAAIQAQVNKNSDYCVDKEKLTVVGELQFGNWALVYRDLFRLLDADSDPGVDLYIYITADKELSGLLSSQTVSFDSTATILQQYRSIIRVPIWLIGLGIEGFRDEAPKTL